MGSNLRCVSRVYVVLEGRNRAVEDSVVIADVAVGMVDHQHAVLHPPSLRNDQDDSESMVEASIISGHDGMASSRRWLGGKSVNGCVNSICAAAESSGP